MKVTVTCKCGKEFQTTTWRINDGRGRYCSKKCMYLYAVHKKGYKLPNAKGGNKTSFKKGNKPWNTGKHGLISWNNGLKGIHLSPQSEFKKGSIPWNFNKPFLQIRDEKHFNWKGDDVKYEGLHFWVCRRLGKAIKCEKCNTQESKKYHWHNISMTYKRDINDWMSLCSSCHKKLHIAIRKQANKLNVV